MKSSRRLAIAVLLSATAGSATLGFIVDGSRWEAGGTTFHIGAGMAGVAPSGQSWAAAFAAAMAAWSEQTDFTFVADNTVVDPCNGYSRDGDGLNFPLGNGDGSNSADFRSSVCGNDFGSGVLAITLNFSTRGSLGFQSIVQSDIIFNDIHNWDIYAGPVRGAVDFHRVALHELGHALGLDHEPVALAIMAPHLSSVDTLQSDDIAGANQIYRPSFDCLVTDMPLNARANASLVPGDCRVLNLFAGSDTSFVDVYRISVASTTQLNLAMTSAELDSVIVVTDANLNQIEIFDDIPGSCDAGGAITLPPGSYLLLANTYVEPVKCPGNIGSYSLTITESTQPVLGAVRNASGGAATAAALITGGATTNDGGSFAASFTASEQIDVLARLAPDIQHVGLPGRLYVLATLDDGRQFMKAASGGFLPYPGTIAGLQAFRAGNLALLEPITIVDNLSGIGSGLAGHTFTVHVGYAIDSSPFDIYYGSTPIRFTIGAN